MKISHMNVTLMHTNAYLYYDELTMDAALIDPGGNSAKIMETINDNGLKLTAILLTHGHFDHIGAVNEIRELTGAPVMAHEIEDELLKSEIYNESKRIARRPVTVSCDSFLKEDDIIEVGAGKLQVIHTPGHTSGGVCFYDKENAVLFSGDTLFRDSVGRYDLVTSSGEALFDSIKNKLFKLPDNVSVLPGHNSPTEIGREKRYNSIVGSMDNSNGL